MYVCNVTMELLNLYSYFVLALLRYYEQLSFAYRKKSHNNVVEFLLPALINAPTFD